MKKLLVAVSTVLLFSCSSDAPKCDNDTIKKSLIQTVKDGTSKTFQSDDVSIKMTGISSKGTHDGKRSCEADLKLTIKNAKYTTKTTATLGAE